MDTSQTFGAPLSGLPPLAYLSGLNLGQGGLSGAQDASLSGSGGTQGSLVPGMAGGPGLDELSQLLATAGAGDTGVGAVGSTPFALQALGQQPTQTGGYGVAGQTAAPGGLQGGAQAQGAAAGSSDPLAILQKILGIGQKAAGLLGSGGGGSSPYGTAGQGTVGGGGAQTSGFETGIASPINLGGFGDPNVQGVPPGAGFQDPNIAGQTGGYSSGITPDLTLVNQAGPGVTPSSIQQVYDAAISAGMTNDQITEILNTPGGLDQLSQLVPGQGFEMTAVGGSGAPGYATAGQNNLGGQVGGGISGALGLLNLIQGGERGNVAQQIGGGLQGVGGLTQLLQSSPDLARSLGLSGALPGVGAGIGGLGGLLGLAQGIQSGNPVQIGSGALGALSAGSSLYGQLAGTGVSGLSGALATLAPETAAQIASALGSQVAANAGTQAISQALNTALSGVGAAAAPIVMAIVSYIGEAQRKEALSSGIINNPIAGSLYSAATSGVGKDLQALQQLQQSGGIGAADTQQLTGLLPSLLNNLGPYYATAQLPGGGAARASTTVTGEPYAYGGRRTPYGNAAEYTANADQARQGMYDVVQELLNRGMTYEQLGQLPVSGNFWQLGMDMANPLQQMYQANAAQYNQAAQPLLQSLQAANRIQLDPREAQQIIGSGQNPETFGYTQGPDGNWYTSNQVSIGNGNTMFLQQGQQITPEMLFEAAQGSALQGPGKATNATGLITSMFGGPLWAALARMGSPFQQQIQQHFNPWASIGGFSGAQLQTAMQPILAQLAMDGGIGSGGSAPSDAGIGVGEGF